MLTGQFVVLHAWKHPLLCAPTIPIMSTLELAYYQGVSKYLSPGHRDVFSKLLILFLSQLQHPFSIF